MKGLIFLGMLSLTGCVGAHYRHDYGYNVGYPVVQQPVYRDNYYPVPQTVIVPPRGRSWGYDHHDHRDHHRERHHDGHHRRHHDD